MLNQSTTSWTAVNPARAGMIPETGKRAWAAISKPRASGDDPASARRAAAGVR